MSAELDASGRLSFRADSDAELTKGLCAVLVEGLAGLTPAELLALSPDALGPLGLGPAVLTPSRANGFLNMLEAMKTRARMLTANLPRFPSLLIRGDGASAQGAFAEAQVRGAAGAGWAEGLPSAGVHGGRSCTAGL